MNTISADPKRFDRDALVAVIEGAGGVFRGDQCRCPWHEDKNASAGIYCKDGVWRFHCHVCQIGGDVFDMESKVAGTRVLPEREPKAESPAKKAGQTFATLDDLKRLITFGRVEDAYHYANGLVVLRIRKRDGGKDILQVTKLKTGFRWGAPAGPHPLYRSKEIADADRVVVCEGELCVKALEALGIPATTSPMGQGKAHLSDWSTLAGKLVHLWPDNDGVGRKHMAEVAKILDTLNPPAKVRVVDIDALGLPTKGDCVDFIAACDGDPKTATEAVLGRAKTMGAAIEVTTLIEDTICGRREAIAFPWNDVSRLTRALLPGTVTLICGDPGSTKTFALLQSLAHWHTQGVRVACWMLEENRVHHLQRALAQHVGESNLTDPEWIKINSVSARMHTYEHNGFLDSFGRVIHDSPTDEPTLAKVAEWVEARIKDECRVIAVDPITAAIVPDKQWVEDNRFLGRVKRALKDANASLLLVTHPKAGRNGVISLEQMAGSQAYARFAQSIMWLQFHAEPVTVKVRSVLGGREEVQCNRMLHLSKTRNGRGGGLKIAFNFDAETLRLNELGIVLK